MPTPNSYLRMVRKRRGLTMTALAERAGLTTATISRIENGQRNASDDALAAIAAVLDVDPALLVPAEDGAA